MIQDLKPEFGRRPPGRRLSCAPNPRMSSRSTSQVNAGAIDYDALQVALVKRLASDYSYRVSYTLGYSRGNTSGGRHPMSGVPVS
jgi:hypothetical protein